MTQNTMTEELYGLVQTMEEMQEFVDGMPAHAWAEIDEDEDLLAVLDGHRDDWEKALVLHIYVDMVMADAVDKPITPKHEWLLPYLNMAKQYHGIVYKNKPTKQKRAKRTKK